MGIVAAGAALRLLLLLTAERVVDADEAVVGVMALDLLEGRDAHFFFRGLPYNGGAAWEAALGAALFAVAGPSAVALKGGAWAIWVATALVFADFCRRTQPRRRARLAMLFFCVGTPFFLEWSLKVRGGYAETVAASVALLWLARPPGPLAARPRLQGAVFGGVAGLGLWASEMLLAWLPLALVWLLAGARSNARRELLTGVAAGALAGLMPLLVWNLAHGFAHARASVLAALLGGTGGEPLDPTQLRVAARFVGGVAWPLALAGLGVAAVRCLRAPRRLELSHLLLLHVVGYGFVFWIAGLRYLEVPPSRVLYVLAPSLSLLLAYAADVPRTAGRGPLLAANLLVGLWVGAAVWPVVPWLRSGEPREADSWRGSWSLVDGEALRGELERRNVELAVTNPWTAASLEFAVRLRAHAVDGAVGPTAVWKLPAGGAPESGSLAFVLHPRGRLLGRVERRLAEASVTHERSRWDRFVLLSGLDAELLGRLGGLPRVYTHGDWSPVPHPLDGFN